MEYLLECEFNLLIYGVGSKKQLVNNFAERIEMPKIIVNGYHAATTIKAVLNAITNYIKSYIYPQKNRKTFHSQQEQIEDIKKVMNKLKDVPGYEETYLLVVIHSLDIG
jgi:hypothetical protein